MKFVHIILINTFLSRETNCILLEGRDYCIVKNIRKKCGRYAGDLMSDLLEVDFIEKAKKELGHTCPLNEVEDKEL